MGDTDKEKKIKVLFVISSVPFSNDFDTIYNLSKVLIKSAEVEFFLTGNGVYYLVRPETEEFSKWGIKIYFCAHAAHQRGIKDIPSWAESSSTYNLSRMMQEADKVISFN